MTRLIVSLDVPTAVEARRAARLVGDSGAGVRVGPRLVARVGPGVIGALRSAADVLVDVRLGGGTEETTAAVRSLAGLGARWISVASETGAEALSQAAAAAAEYGTDVLAVTVPPEAPSGPRGRGRSVSEACRRLVDTGVSGVLATVSDIGVVAQIAPELGTFVFGVEDVPGVAEAVERGATGIVVDGGIAGSPDPAAALARFADVVAAR